MDVAGNQGPPSEAYFFRLEGSSSGLPTWALIVIIVGSIVAGIIVIAVTWLCCCKRKPKKEAQLNGMYASGMNGYVQNNGYYNDYGYNDRQINGYNVRASSYTVNGARPYAGAIPDDPIAAQHAALANVAQNVNGHGVVVEDDEDIKKAIEASIRETQRPVTSDNTDLDAAIAASLFEAENGQTAASYGNAWPRRA